MKAHRPFLLVSLALSAVAGTGLGLGMLLGWLGWVSTARYALLLSAHAQLQVYGFVSLFTMGVALLMLPRVLGAPLTPPALPPLSLVLMVAGIGANLAGPTPLGAALQSLSTLAFLLAMRATRRAAPARRRLPLDRSHALYLATGALWLLVAPGLALLHPTRALETVLWGFAGLYIAGIGLRIHPSLLGVKGVREGLLIPAAGLWNGALVLRWLGFEAAWGWALAGGVGLFLLALRPFRASTLPAAGGAWVRAFVRTSYAWLVAAVAMTCLGAVEGATRHALATGFVLTMMMGMGLRMIPAFEVRRLVWTGAPWPLFALITAGTALRVGAQAAGEVALTALGGAVQVLAILLFVAVLGGTVAFGRRVEAPAVA